MKTFKTNQSMISIIRKIIFVIPLVLISMTLSAQDDGDYEKAKMEIEQTFGTFPSWFDAYPEYALSSVWGNFKTLKGPKGTIAAKNKELIQLAVAAQIPCEYCVYFHTAVAKANGATQEEINEAVALGAETRHWSMILQGSGLLIDDFKKEFDGIMAYMAEQTKK